MEDEKYIFDTQTEELLVETPSSTLSIAFIKPETENSDKVILTPTAVKNLVEQNIKVFMQHGFALGSSYTDADYADAGVEFVEKFVDLALLSKTLVKYDSFNEEQITAIPQERVLFTAESPKGPTARYINMLNEKRCTAIAADLAKGDDNTYIFERIRKESLSGLGLQVAVSGFVAPLIETIVHSPNISYALQLNPMLIQCIYTHAAWLCSPQIAEKTGLPWRDILSLCWELN